MSQSFRPGHLNISNEPQTSRDTRVAALESDQETIVRDYQLPELRRPEERGYTNFRSKYGPLSATDPSRRSKTQKDARFQINPLLRDPLSIEEEERRQLEERVHEELLKVSGIAAQEGQEKGFREGFEQGLQDGMAQAMEEGRQKLEDLNRVLVEMDGHRESIYRANEQSVVELVFQVAKKVLLKELAVDRDYVTRLCAELVDRTSARENIRICISAQDQANIEEIRKALNDKFGTLKNLEIEANPKLSPHEVSVDTQFSLISARVDEQLEAIQRDLFDNKPSSEPNGQ